MVREVDFSSTKIYNMLWGVNSEIVPLFRMLKQLCPKTLTDQSDKDSRADDDNARIYFQRTSVVMERGDTHLDN